MGRRQEEATFNRLWAVSVILLLDKPIKESGFREPIGYNYLFSWRVCWVLLCFITFKLNEN